MHTARTSNNQQWTDCQMGGFQTQQRNACYKNLICLVTQSCLTPLKVNTVSGIHCMSYGKTKTKKALLMYSVLPPQVSSSSPSSCICHFRPAKFAWLLQSLSVPSALLPFCFSWRWSTSRRQQGPGEGSESEVRIGWSSAMVETNRS